MEAASAPALRERCAIHPHVDAIGTCERCGSYYCVACCKVIEGRTACRGCLQIPGVDYLRALRDRCWGKRDGWVWYHGFFGSVAGLVTLAFSLQKHAYVDLPVLIIGLPISVAYFLLKPAARRWLFAPTALSLFVGVAERLHVLPGVEAKVASLAYAATITVAFGLCALAYVDPRNRLAFRIEISDSELARLHKRMSNATAIRSLVYGVLSLAVPLLGLLSLSFGVAAWRQANREAWPPIGGRGIAIAGITVSCAGLCMWTSLAIYLFMRR